MRLAKTPLSSSPHSDARGVSQVSDAVDAVVVGAGLVGVACARLLARQGREVIVVERHGRAGCETSSRNSGVIHAGLYYPPGSVKAITCVRGRELLYEYCARRGVPHRRTGKLVVAVDEGEAEGLVALAHNAERSGVAVALRDRRWLARREPALRGVLALDVPSSGVVDPHALLTALKADATDAGAVFAFRTDVRALEAASEGWTVVAGETTVRARLVINAGGLGADQLAAAAGCDVEALGWTLHPSKGCWFDVAPRAPQPRRALVYPMPVRGGLGIHLTRGIDGRLLAGPDVRPARLGDYDVPTESALTFARAVARYLPGLKAEHLSPAYAGLRPKRRTDGGFADFVVEERPAGVVQLVGIESPGLTAALALAERVGALALAHD